MKSANNKPKVVAKFTCDHKNCIKFRLCEMYNEKEVYKILLPSAPYDGQKVRCLPLAAQIIERHEVEEFEFHKLGKSSSGNVAKGNLMILLLQ